jgi:capsular polysaccharide biosynthesis protein/GGDEF domain-containing protein
MDSGRYVDIALRRWPIVALAFLVTTILTIAFALSKPTIYESSATFVVHSRLRGEEAVQATGTLAREMAINATFANIARSKTIRADAVAQLGGADAVPASFDVDAEVVTGTNTLEVTVRSSDPDVAHDVATAIGDATVEYADREEALYRIVPLDPSEVPEAPVPTRTGLTIALGMAGGLVLGVFLAVFAEWISNSDWRGRLGGRPDRLPAREDTSLGVENVAPFRTIDATSGLFSSAFLTIRLREEIARANEKGGSFSLGLITMEEREVDVVGNGSAKPFDGRRRARYPRRVAQFLRTAGLGLRADDTLARLDDRTFALLLPDRSRAAAADLLESWKALITSFVDNGAGKREAPFAIRTSVCEYERRARDFVGDPEAEDLARIVAELGVLEEEFGQPRPGGAVLAEW